MLFQGMNTSASALTAQRLRLDTASANMANAETTRGRIVDGEWVPYRRKMVTLAAQDSRPTFSPHLKNAQQEAAGGVKVSRIIEDTSPFRMLHEPGHPDADMNGYVHLPNVDPLKEMVDVMGATRSYEANVTVFDAHKGLMMKAMEIGRS